MINNTIHDIENLLPRYCEGLANKEETTKVEQWIEEDEKHLQIVKQMSVIYFAIDMLRILRKVDTNASLKRVNDKIGISNKHRLRMGLLWFQRVAALLAIPLLFTTLFLYFHRGEDIAQYIEIKTNPGTTTVVILPDSTRVCLNSESSLRYPGKFVGDIYNLEIKKYNILNQKVQKKREDCYFFAFLIF